MPMKVRYTVVNGQVIAENRNGVRKTYVPDPSGSTIALLDDKQKITDTFSYSPFGELKSRTGTTPTPFQYIGTKGYYTDPNNRIYVRARTYQPNYARWMTVDPLWPGESAYGYARGNPSTLADPSGQGIKEFWDCYYKLIGGGWGERNACKKCKSIFGGGVNCDGFMFPDKPNLSPAVVWCIRLACSLQTGQQMLKPLPVMIEDPLRALPGLIKKCLKGPPSQSLDDCVRDAMNRRGPIFEICSRLTGGTRIDWAICLLISDSNYECKRCCDVLFSSSRDNRDNGLCHKACGY
jgi:RHS repeat-associated protein